MPECPCCHGEGGFDLSDMDAPLERLCVDVFGAKYVPFGVAMCDICEGEGEVSAELARDYEAYWTARTDQLIAAVDSGEVVVP